MEMNPNILAYPCPFCQAQPGESCVMLDGVTPYPRPHFNREPVTTYRQLTDTERADRDTLQWLTNVIVRGNGF